MYETTKPTAADVYYTGPIDSIIIDKRDIDEWWLLYTDPIPNLAKGAIRALE